AAQADFGGVPDDLTPEVRSRPGRAPESICLLQRQQGIVELSEPNVSGRDSELAPQNFFVDVVGLDVETAEHIGTESVSPIGRVCQALPAAGGRGPRGELSEGIGVQTAD